MFERKAQRRKARGAVRRSPANTVKLRFRLRYVLLLLLCAALAGGVWYIDPDFERPKMNFEHVRINAQFANLSPASVETAVRANLDGDYFSLDLDAIREAVLALPWVQEVSVRRRWPSGLDLSIIEKQAVARWGDTALLSHRGVVFTPGERYAGAPLPALRGPDGLHGKVWQFYVDVSERLLPHGLSVSTLVFDDRRSWQLELADGLQIRLGRNDIDHRLKRLYQVFTMREELGVANMTRLDMRYPNGFAAVQHDARQTDTGAGDARRTIPFSLYNDNKDDNTVTRVNEV